MCIFRTSHINRNKELKSLFFCYWSSSAKHVWIFIFQSILNLTRNYFPKSFKRKVQQVASYYRNTERISLNVTSTC